MPHAAASPTFKLVLLEGVPEPLLARHLENGQSGAPHGLNLEAELARHDWDAAPCFVITRLRRDPTPTCPEGSLRSSLGDAEAAFADREELGRASASAQARAADDVRRSLLVRWALAFVGALQRAQQRRALSLLDPRLLEDIRVTPEEAAAEARKPPWRR